MPRSVTRTTPLHVRDKPYEFRDILGGKKLNNLGKLRLAGVAVAATMILPVLSACGGDTAGKSNADLLKEGAANMKTAKSYHLDADITQADQNVKMNGDIDTANKNSMLAMSMAGQNVNMIIVGADNYMSIDGGKTYSKGNASAASGMSSFTGMWDSFKPEDVDKAKDSLKDGSPATETIGGAATKHITANAKDLSALGSSGSSSTTEGTIDLWISTDAKPYIRQMKIDGTSDGKPLKATLTWTKFDEKFDIKAPPVQ